MELKLYNYKILYKNIGVVLKKKHIFLNKMFTFAGVKTKKICY